ncbi:5360_t:CDS:2, partial [Dentiscutata erythropus]
QWMTTVGEILPELYKKNKNDGNKNVESTIIYKRCFCGKGLDIPFFDFLVIPPSTDNYLEVFIPITQLVPQDSVLKVEEISHDKIPDVQMVPLIDFVTNSKSLEVKGNEFMNILKSIVLPNNYLPQEECTIPFLSLIDNVEYDHIDPFYFNPSTEAIMNFMWYSSKSHWLKSLYIFIIYFLSYSIISWMYIAHIQVTGIWYELILLLRIFPGFAHYLNILYKIVIDIRSFLLFFALAVIAMGHALFIFLGYASYIGLSESPESFEVFNGSTIIYNMTEEEPEDIFTNPFTAIIAAYNWDSISLDVWGFWPLLIISVIGNIVFVIILQNVIVSFMSAAFENADKDGKCAVLTFQSRLIYDYANLERSAFTSGKSNFDNELKDKLRVKYICFYNEPSITKAWKHESKEWESTPIYSNFESEIQAEDDKSDESYESEFFIEKEDIKFIWTSAEE